MTRGTFFHLPEDLVTKLKHVAIDQKTTNSELAARVLRAYLDKFPDR